MNSPRLETWALPETGVRLGLHQSYGGGACVAGDLGSLLSMLQIAAATGELYPEWKKMNKTLKSVKRPGTDTADAFFRRSAVRAQKLDRGETLLPEMRLTFGDPADLLRVLTEQRIRILTRYAGIQRRSRNWLRF